MRKAAERVALGLLLAGGFGALGSTCAYAGDDGSGSLLDSVASFVGMQADKDEESIDYRARAPIVLPKDASLPAPQPTRSRAGNWPTDPAVIARRKEAAARNAPAPQQETINGNGRISPAELATTRHGLPDGETRSSGCLATAGTPSCLYTAWDKLKSKVTGSDEKDLVVGGVEPPREYLTEPPAGYRTPITTTKVAPIKEKAEAEAGDAAAYARANSRHKYSVDE